MNQRGVWQLILMAREGDRHAIDELFYSSFRPAYLILSTITADRSAALDILSESYVQIFQHLNDLDDGTDFDEALNRHTIHRAKALFPTKDFLRLPDGAKSDAAAFRKAPPQLHEFDTLPGIPLGARADEILCILQQLPPESQVCVYLFYLTGTQPEVIADILQSTENRVCSTLQQARQLIIPQIDAVLKKSAAFRGTDAESAIPWALRRTESFVPQPAETEEYYRGLCEKLVSGGVLDSADIVEEEPEMPDEIPMREIAPLKDNHLLHAIFSLRTLIIVLVVLVAVALVIGVRQLHNYNVHRNSLHPHAERTTLSLTNAGFPSERYIFSTEFDAPTETTEPATTEAPESTTEEAPATTEAAAPVTEPTTPVITTTKPYADFKTVSSGGGLAITGYTGSKTSIEVPAKIDGKTVTTIAENAFFNSNISAIRLPSTISSIRKNAFRNCSSLQSISIPSGVQSIETGSFQGCTALRNVTLPGGLTSIGERAFDGCSALTGITIPAAVTRIGQFVFNDCRSLSYCTFEKNSKLQSLGNGTFYGCANLKTCTLPSGIRSIPQSCFAGCHLLASMALPAGVTTIEQNAFANCYVLQSVRFSSNLRRIENSAFIGCSTIREITIPSGTTFIGTSAFSGCTALHTATIPASVSQIGDKAFAECDDLSIICPEGSYAERYAQSNQIPLAGRTTESTYSESSTNE